MESRGPAKPQETEMVASVKEISANREPERSKLVWEQRQVRALEDIADTLEALRIEAVGMQHLMAALARKSP